VPLPKKYAGSKTRGLRIDTNVDLFLRLNFPDKRVKSANDFIINLIKNSEEYKTFAAKIQDDSKQQKLDL
jgi:hypothetical protein